MQVGHTLKSWALGPLLFIVLLTWSILTADKDPLNFALIVSSGLVGVYLLLFKKDVLFSICIFSIPLSAAVVLPIGWTMSAPAEIITVTLALVLIAIAISRPTVLKSVLFHPFSILIVIDLSWMIITSFTSEFQLYSLKRCLARLVFLLIFYLLGSHWLMKKENMIKFFLLYCIGLVYPILKTTSKLSYYHFDFRTIFDLSRPFYDDHTIFGACLAFVLPFSFIIALKSKTMKFSGYTRILVWVLFGLLLIGEFIAFSRAAWLSLFFAGLMYLFLIFKGKFWQLMLVLLVAVGIAFAYQDKLFQMGMENTNVSNKGEVTEHIMSVSNVNSDASNLERINRWRSAIRMFYDRPMTGFGPGTYQFVYGPYQSVYEMTPISTISGDRGNAHSEPLTYLCESGFPGFISYLCWSLAVFGFGIRAYHRTRDKIIRLMVLAVLLGYTTFFFHGLVNSFIDQIKMASLVFASMALIVSVDIMNKSKQHEQPEKKMD